jgi:hypothetical protein
MSWSIDIRKGKVYIPSCGDTKEGIVLGIEPIEVADLGDVAGLRAALNNAINRGRKLVPLPSVDSFDKHPIHQLAGVKTWSAYYKGTRQLFLVRRDGSFEIFALKKGDRRGYVPDEPTREWITPDVPLAPAIDRIVERIQREASQ